jgi:hypothetical protein
MFTLCNLAKFACLNSISPTCFAGILFPYYLYVVGVSRESLTILPKQSALYCTVKGVASDTDVREISPLKWCCMRNADIDSGNGDYIVMLLAVLR